MNIRQAKDSDRAAIGAVHMSAFGEKEGQEVVGLVCGLLDDETAKPLLSLVAEMEGRIVGHVLFSSVRLQPKDQSVPAQILAPLAVAKDHQSEGVGGALIEEGLKQLAAAEVELIFVLGHPGYYPRFGFRPAGALGFEAPYPIPAAHEAAWIVQELKAGVIGSVRGKIRCATTLEQPQHWQE